MKIRRLGEVITSKDIPAHIPSNNINGPTVFERPEFFPEGPKSKIGSGSSFKDSKIDPEEVHLRYKLLASSDKKAYINITSNAEINRHCSTIFGINVESND